MNFIVNSTALSRQLARVAGAIPSKSINPIIENFLFDVANNELTISTTNTEVTMQTKLSVEVRGNDIKVAVPSKILQDMIKALPDQPLTFSVDEETFSIEINSENGVYKLLGENGSLFPLATIPTTENTVQMPIPVLLKAINKVLFAASTDEDREALTGMHFNLGEHGAIFVATDAHRLVRYIRSDVTTQNPTSFTVPNKALQLIKSSLDASDNKEVHIHYNDQNAFLITEHITMSCRLIDKKYPNYENVIPKENPNHLFIGKAELMGSLRRMNVFANRISHQVRLSLKENMLEISAEDQDFANEAKEMLRCNYDGSEMEIGFNAAFLLELVSNVETPTLKMEMSAPNRAGIVLPDTQEDGENTLMLIMPIMLNNF